MKSAASLPLKIAPVPIDKNCIGDRWVVQDEDLLAQLIATVAMGQAAYASHVLKQLVPTSPPLTHKALCHEAKVKLTVQEVKKTPRTGYPRWQRDGFMFETISWIAARQSHGERILLKEPHISATSQGIDGLMLKLADDKSKLVMTTVFEDKCSENPRDTFVNKVMPAFTDRHLNKRSAELVANASVLLRIAGLDEAAASVMVAAVMDQKQRSYRASFALTTSDDSQSERQKLFAGYDALDNLTADQRIGAGLIVAGKMRNWFDKLAIKSIEYLDQLKDDGK